MTHRSPPRPTPDESDSKTTQGQPVRRRGLWLWFAAGFLIVFVGMLLTVRIYSVHPSGEYVVACRLWRYYVIEMQRAVHSSRFLGPTTRSSSAALTTAFQHVLFSALGGAVTLGIGWVVGRRQTWK